MKKFLTIAASAVLAVCLFALAACGGASSTLSSFVSAVKKADFETAAEYVYGGSIASSYIPDIESDDGMYEYMYKQTAGKFKYSVEETSTNDDETATTISISYSFYSFAALVIRYEAATSVLGGKEESKSTVKECLDDMTEITGNTSVVLVQNDDGDWVLEAATATALLTLICL